MKHCILRNIFVIFQLALFGMFMQQVASLNLDAADADDYASNPDIFNSLEPRTEHQLVLRLHDLLSDGNMLNYEPNNNFDNNDLQKKSSRVYTYRRGCIRRAESCDNRPGECCFSSSCRCNLWGSNCRCQRMGIFQKWG